LIALLFLAVLAAEPPPPAPNFELELKRSVDEIGTGDLDEIKKRGVLRVLTRNNSSNYFIVNGQEYGFQLELARAFAEELGVRLEVVVPTGRADLIPALVAGQGDLIAAGMTITTTRSEQVFFTPPVQIVQRVVATHPKTVKPLRSVDDLPSFVLHVNHGSTSFQMTREIERGLGQHLNVQEVGDEMEMEEMLRKVSSGEFEATIADQHLVLLEAGTGSDVVSRLSIGDPVPTAWAVRRDSPQLHNLATRFVEKSRRNGLVRILYDRYFQPRARMARAAKDFKMRADFKGKISPFDDTLRALGRAHRIDWRLLAALVHRESRFDPSAKSPFGAYGLMQVLPSTAKSIDNLTGTTEEIARRLIEDPKLNLRAGTRYLRWLLDRFAEEGIAETERIRFALASYNVGLGHVRDARLLAEQTGRDKNQWFGHVEEALRLKSNRKWHEKTRLGFCRAEEPIRYVREIQEQYELYVRHQKSD
jgi:membrane-bound lytic murein transglycosylase F